MKNQNNQPLHTILLATIATIFLLGAFASTFAQNGIGAKYGSRDPQTCADKTLPKTGAPSAAQAAKLAVLVLAAIVLVRFAWMFGAAYLPRLLSRTFRHETHGRVRGGGH